MEIVRL